MNDVSRLSLLYKQYADGNSGKGEFEASIFEHLMNSPNGHYGLFFKNMDARIDFLCWFYPDLRRIIDRYDKGVAPFGVYLASTLRYSLRYYNRSKRKRDTVEIDCWNSGNSELFVYEPEPDNEAYEGSDAGYKVNSPKRILLVLLKSYYYASDSLVNKVAAATGMNPEVLGEMVDTLRRLQVKKIERVQKLSGAAHCLYYRCLNYERKLSEKCEDTHLNSLISLRLDRGRKRLENMRKRLKSIRIEATNSEISKILGLPKGTVDSRMSMIKTKQAINRLKF
ncbi:MAG: hypothetical protein LBD86_06830 [Spirochaetaceae bacterium]|jgi:hypothetical protein|nr:hypothetical protein [Spirochaetaceae bacterium]